MHAGWALPGGTVENGEDFQGAYEREIVEEVGIQIYDTSLFFA
jgi:ADP-ribose pyrophosphatase YjhB (NUDIX family)